MRSVLLVIAVLTNAMFGQLHSLESALLRAGPNRVELERAIAALSGERKESMVWLISHMPDSDLRSLDATYLVENVKEAHDAFESAPWRSAVPRAVFLDAVLPYANVTEKREPWRTDFRTRFAPMVARAKTPSEAAVILNQRVFADLNVKYSTQRSRADQGPLESQRSGLASCTGLTVILVDACRAVGVPARFAGTPLWSDGSGNHSWAEIWDGNWKFTGAAEPTGDRLNEGWFVDRAARAIAGDLRRGIFAVTWADSPLVFPMVWAPNDRSVRGIDVSERYKKVDNVPLGLVRVRFRLRSGAKRVAAPFEVRDQKGAVVHRGETRDESCDANDHVTVHLPLGVRFVFHATGIAAPTSQEFMVGADEQLVDISMSSDAVARPDSRDSRPETRESLPRLIGDPVTELQKFLSDGGALEAATSRPFSSVPLSQGDVARATEIMVSNHRTTILRDRSREMSDRVIEIPGAKMPFWYAVYGEKPTTGRRLWISMHGGGGAPKRVNDQQWENQKRLYRPTEGVYVAPRAPTDTWDLWHLPHIDVLFDRLIENMIAFEGVDPNRVYLLGYSAGGDGAYQLAPRMADRWAAAAMMAGHPGDASALSLRNLPFTIHMGGKDAAYDRNRHAREWKVLLEGLHKSDPEGYSHRVDIHESKGHWMDREDNVAIPWMAQFTRDLRPARVVWKQDDVTTRSSYWLQCPQPAPRSRIVVARKGQVVTITESDGIEGQVGICLDDSMIELGRAVTVMVGNREVFHGKLERTLGTMISTLISRGDLRGIFSARVTVSLAP